MLAQVLVALGLLLMLYNVGRGFLFARDQENVLVDQRSRVLSRVVLALIVLFALAYAYIFFLDLNELSIGLILIGGSVFVTIVLHWIIHLETSIKRTTGDMAVTLTTVIEARDPNLRGHSRHVLNLVRALYEHLPDDMRHNASLTNLEYAAIFHDIGKLGVPEAVLNKKEAFTKEDWNMVRQHPRIGVEILDSVKSFKDIEDWILCHHERIDGNGYYHVKGDQIPLGARIIAVPDTFSAMYMSRPYDDFTSYEECIAELKRVAGTQLDARVVEAFCNIPRETVVACAKGLPFVDHSQRVHHSDYAGTAEGAEYSGHVEPTE